MLAGENRSAALAIRIDRPSNLRLTVENNDYDADPANLFKQGENRNYRHRLLQTVVALRNL